MNVGGSGIDLVPGKADPEIQNSAVKAPLLHQSLSSADPSLASCLAVFLHVVNKMAADGLQLIPSQTGIPAERCLTPRVHKSILGKTPICPPRSM